MGNAIATVYSGSEYTISDEISGDFFGGNFLFTRDRSDGTFSETVDHVNINLLRYPGGGMTELYFDVNNPDSIPNGETRETLTEFLTFSGESGITPVIVIPIKNYIRDGIPVEQAAAEIFRFVQRVTNGEFGSVKIDTFEIGNEYNIGELQITGAEYGVYAAAFALAIKEASTYDVDVAVQAGSHWGTPQIAIDDNIQILNAFIDADALDAVDTLAFHTYPKDFDDVDSQIATTMPESVIEDWNNATGKDLEIFVSEWNIINSWDSERREDYGLAQASTLLEMVSKFIKMGVDIAAIWAVQQGTKTELAGLEGSGKMRIAGELFRMLSESTVGTRALDLPEDTIGDGQVSIYAYESKSKMVIFLSAHDLVDDDSPYTVDLNISGLVSNFAYVWGERLSTDDPTFWHNATPSLSTFFPSLNISGDISNISVTFDNDYEVIKLVFLKDVFDDTPIHIVGDDIDDNFVTGGGDDTIESSGGSDTIRSKTGDDKIVSGDGDDTVISGRGDDVVWGGEGRDTIRGNEGDDIIGGGAGDDIIYGGKGDDIIYGGEGNDLLQGGENDDTLYGGPGDDIVGGGKGNDLLYGGGGNDLLKGGPGNDTLYGGLGNDVLRGSFGNDIIYGNEGDDILWGGEGQDIFVFTESAGNDVISDFELGQDVIDIASFGFDDITQTITDSGLELSFGNSSVMLAGLLSTLEIDNFLH